MDTLTNVEKRRLAMSMRKYRDQFFPGRGGIGRFAKSVGVSPRTLSRWLSGVLSPSPEHLHALAKALEMDERELYGRRKAREADKHSDFPEIVRGQIDVIDTQMLLLRHNKRALLGEADTKRHKESVRIIGMLLKTELGG
jgi:transcriptional regulator with XRE-family HTH domain